MKRNVLVLTTLGTLAIFGLLGMGGTKEEPKTPVLAVVQTNIVFEQSKLGKAGMERLETMQKNAIAKLEGLQKDIAAADEAKDEAKKQELQMELQNLLYTMQTIMQEEQDKVVEKIRTIIQTTVDGYCQSSGTLAVFSNESMLGFNPTADVTKDILALLEKQNYDFGPLPSLEGPSPEEVQALQNMIDSQMAAPAENPAEAPKTDAAPAAEAAPTAETAPATEAPKTEAPAGAAAQ